MTLPPRLERALLAALVLASVGAYAWHLGINHWANAYYAGLVQTGSWSATSAFYGSMDVGNVVSTDKPPLALWVMEASVRLFGLSPVPLLMPQVLLSALSVLLLALLVRRVAGPWAGLLAGGLLAVTPVFVILARYDDPDTLLVTCTLAAGYAAVRGAGDPRRRWALLLGAALGLAFMAKWVVGLVIVPALLWSLWPVLRRRMGLVVPAGAAFAVTGLSWVAVLAVLGPQHRPYPDASGGSLLQLVLGANGVSRLSGNGGGAISGTPSPWRLLTPIYADQIGWLLPAALVLGACLVVWHRLWARPSTDPHEAGVRLLVGWLALDTVLFSAMGGAMHPYYTVLLAPAVAGCVAVGAVEVVRRRSVVAGALAAALTLGYAAWASGSVRLPTSGVARVLIAAGALGLVVVVVSVVRSPSGRERLGSVPRRRARPAAAVAAGLVALGLLAGPLLTDLVTLGTSVDGPDPRAGAQQDDTAMHVDGGLAAFVAGVRGGTWAVAAPQASPAAELQLVSGRPVLPLGGFTGSLAAPTVTELESFVAEGRLRYVALVGQWTARPAGTPSAQAHHPLAGVIDWARATGCPHREGAITVIDLTDQRCHAASSTAQQPTAPAADPR